MMKINNAEQASGNSDAIALGIDREFVSKMVDAFYTRIREDKSLGPIFNRHIKDWDVHLPTMKEFWASVALGLSGYSGRPMPAHVKLSPEVKPEHFSQWLALFRESLRELTSSEKIVEHFMFRANRIALALQKAMFEGA